MVIVGLADQPKNVTVGNKSHESACAFRIRDQWGKN